MSTCVHERIRKDQERLKLRNLLLAASAPAAPADAGYFQRLRDRLRPAANKLR